MRDFKARAKEVLAGILLGGVLPITLYYEVLPFRYRLALPFWSPLLLGLIGAGIVLISIILVKAKKVSKAGGSCLKK